MAQPLTTVNWFLSASVSGTDYNLVPMPITSAFLESLKGSQWIEQAHPALKRCNSFTFAKRGFSSSLGYLAFDVSDVVGSTTVGAVLKAIIDNRLTTTLVQQYIDETGTLANYYAYRLYIDEVEVFHSQNGYMNVAVAKLVDNRYYAPILGPIRNSTHSFSTYSSDARAVDTFYTGFNGPDWESSSAAEYPTLYEQLCYWQPAFRNWTVTIPNSSPLTGAGITVSPQAETAYGCFKKLIEHGYATTFCDLQINSADGHATVVTNVPAPSDLTAYGDSGVSCGYYRYKTSVSSVKYEVLFSLNRKNIWNTETTLRTDFKLRFLNPYTQPTRVPASAYLAYYPNGIPSGTDECISIIANENAVPDRESSKASGPVGTDLSNADKYDFDYSAMATLGDAVIAKYLANNQAYSFFQSKLVNGFADPYTYGTTPALICGARFILQDIPTTELFWGVRFQVRETEGLPYCGVAEQVRAVPPVDATLHLRQLGEQAFEELQIPYSSWSNHTEVKIYGHATYSAGDYTPVSSSTCDAIYAMGEAKVAHARLDENTGETNSYGISESHVLVKSRDLIVGVNFVGYQMNDGHYRPIDQPSIRVGAVQSRWDTIVSPSVATASANMHVKFLAPYFKQSNATTGNLTDPTPLIIFDRYSFRVYDVDSQTDQLKTAFATTNSVNPTMAFVTSANRVLLGKTTSDVASEASGTVNIYKGTAGSETAETFGPSSTNVTVTAWNHGTDTVTSGTWVYVVEINEYWYMIPASGGGGGGKIYWGRTDEAGFKDGASFTVSVLSGTGTGTDTGTNIEVVSKIADIDANADIYFTKPDGCDDYHLLNGECEVT